MFYLSVASPSACEQKAEFKERMENGGLALDELMNAYEEGAQLAKALSDRLARAKARLYEVKAAKDGTMTTEPSDIAVQGSLLDNLQS